MPNPVYDLITGHIDGVSDVETETQVGTVTSSSQSKVERDVRNQPKLKPRDVFKLIRYYNTVQKKTNKSLIIL